MIRAAKNPLGSALVWRLVRGALRGRMNAVHVRGAPPATGTPVIFAPNHSTWWDGYLCMALNQSLLHRPVYLMMEEKNLRRYRFFTWAGGFGIDRDDVRAALASLEYAADVMKRQPNAALYVFPQGTMIPNERRPLELFSGLARLALRVPGSRIVPLAFRYQFLQEQRPDAFISIGAERIVTATDRPGPLTTWLAEVMMAELDALTADVIAERFDGFTTVLHGTPGIDRRFDRLMSRGERKSRRLEQPIPEMH